MKIPLTFFFFFILNLLDTFALYRDEFTKILISTDGKSYRAFDYLDSSLECVLPKNPHENFVQPPGLFGNVIQGFRQHQRWLIICGTHFSYFYHCAWMDEITKKWDLRLNLEFKDLNETLNVKSCENDVNAYYLAMIRTPREKFKRSIYYFNSYELKQRQSGAPSRVVYESKALRESDVFLFPGVENWLTHRFIVIVGYFLVAIHRCLGVYKHTRSLVNVFFPTWEDYPAGFTPRLRYKFDNVTQLGQKQLTFTGKGSRFLMERLENVHTLLLYPMIKEENVHSSGKHMIFLEVKNRAALSQNGTFIIFDPDKKEIHLRRIYESNINLDDSSEFIKLRKTFGVLLPNQKTEWDFYIFNGNRLVFEKTELSIDYEKPADENLGQVSVGIPDEFVSCIHETRQKRLSRLDIDILTTTTTTKSTSTITGETLNTTIIAPTTEVNLTGTVSSSQTFAIPTIPTETSKASIIKFNLGYLFCCIKLIIT